MSVLTSSIVVGHKSSRCHLKPYQRSQDVLSWNPISKLGVSSFNNDEMIRFGCNKSRVLFDNKVKRSSLTAYADIIPGAPLPSTPPPSGSTRSWILGLVISLILPFFSHRWGPLWVMKNRIDEAVQRVEDVVEVVEKVAGEVDKIAEDMGDDLPQGKLRDMVKYVEVMAEKTAQTADSLDNLIDKVQETEEQVERMVESLNNEVKNSPEQAIAPLDR